MQGVNKLLYLCLYSDQSLINVCCKILFAHAFSTLTRKSSRYYKVCSFNRQIDLFFLKMVVLISLRITDILLSWPADGSICTWKTFVQYSNEFMMTHSERLCFLHLSDLYFFYLIHLFIHIYIWDSGDSRNSIQTLLKIQNPGPW